MLCVKTIPEKNTTNGHGIATIDARAGGLTLINIYEVVPSVQVGATDVADVVLLII